MRCEYADNTTSRSTGKSSNASPTGRIAGALRQHLAAERLKNAWSLKEKFERCLEGKSGCIVAEIRRFIREKVGDPAIDPQRLNADWSALMVELARVQALSPALAVVRQVTDEIAVSGATLWAEQCRLPCVETIDSVLPDNWRAACRPYRAKTKGKVERPIRYVRESFFYGRTFLNDADLNAQALSWLARIANARIHRTTAEAPRTRFDREERVLLKPLALQPYRSMLLPSATQPAQPYYPLVASVERRPLAWYDRLTGVAP